MNIVRGRSGTGAKALFVMTEDETNHALEAA
jgi:hypothetical protein